MARTRNEKAFEAKRQHILQAATALFIKHGFHPTGMAAICEAAGMSAGALYRYFPSKTDIIRAIVEREQAEADAMFGGLEDAKDFPRAVADMIIDTIEFVSDRTYGRLALEIAAEGARDAEVEAIIVESEHANRASLAARIAQARKAGLVSASIDPEACAHVLQMLVNGSTGAQSVAGALKGRKFKTTVRRIIEDMLEAPDKTL